jgi:hypothetical protein
MNKHTNTFDSLIADILTQLNEADISVSNATAGVNSQIDPTIINKYRANVLKPLADGQQHSIDNNVLKQAIQDGILIQNNDGSHTVSDAALAHINVDNNFKELQGKFQPAQQAAQKAATNKTQTQAQKSSAAANVKNATGQSGQSSTAYAANTTAYGA